MANPIGAEIPREFTPGLQLLVFDPDVSGNDQVEVVDATGSDAGMRYSEAITAANAWQASAEVDLTAYATTSYVDAQMQVILDAVKRDHNAVTVASDLGASLATLAAHIDDVRAALVEQGQPAENAPTADLANMIRAIAPAAPILIFAPVLTGSAVAGATLTSSTGAWAGAQPITFAYQWFLAGVPVAGQTTASYTTDPGDDGLAVFCRVTASNLAGSTPADTAPVVLSEPGGFEAVRADTTLVTADSTLVTADHEAV